LSHELAAFADLASRPAANVGAPAQSILPSSLHPALPMSSPLTLLFVFALALSLALRLWLAARQHAHVRAHRQAVPAAFAGQVSLADHQKAADYTCAKTRLTQLDALWDSAILLGLTLGGGIDALARLWAGWLADPLWGGVPDGEWFYFVHSFYARPLDPRHSVGETEYGARFTSAVARDNIFATQFHPEKSAEHGLALYRNFLHWKP